MALTGNWNRFIQDFVWFLLCTVSGLALLLPNHYAPWLSFHHEAMTAAAYAPALIWIAIQSHTRNTFAPTITLAALVPLIVMAIQTAVTPSLSGDRLLFAFYLIGFVGAIAVGSAIDPGAAHRPLHASAPWTQFWATYVLIGVISWGMAAHQWLDLSLFALFVAEMPPGGRPFANLAQPNHLASLLLCSTAGLAYLHAQRVVRTPTAVVALVVFAHGLAMTQSRTVVAALGLMTVLYAFRQRRNPAAPSAAGCRLFLLTYMALTLLWPQIEASLLLPQTSSTFQRTEVGIRPIYWAIALDSASQRPWFGYGPGNASLAQISSALHHPATHTFFSSAHNIVLDTVIWFGIPAALIVWWITSTFLWRAYRAITTPQAWAAFAVVVAWLTHGLLEHPLSHLYFLLPLGLLLGSLAHETGARPALPRWPHPRPRVARIGLSIAVVLWTVAGAKMAAEYLYWEKQWEASTYRRLGFMSSQHIDPPDSIWLTQIAETHWILMQQPEPGLSVETIEKAKTAAFRHPNSVALRNYAQMAALNGRPEEARLSLELLCNLHSPQVCNQARREWEAAAATDPRIGLIAFPAPGQRQETAPSPGTAR